MKKTVRQLTQGVALASTLLLSTASLASGGNGGGGGGNNGAGFADLLDRAGDDGNCRVSTVRPIGTDSTFYVPSGGSGQYNILVWGNGTGGTSTTYSTLLASVASHCILVAAANTANAGTGEEMEDALDQARSRYGNIIRANAKVCTAGHSQGGGGSFNAANLVDADCVIPVQPDTRFTTRIEDDLARNVEVITLWSEDDTLAPASGNRRNVQGASTILVQVETAGEDHFEPTSGRAGVIGSMFRMANIAQLSDNSALAAEFRGAFFGAETDDTVTESNRGISDVRRNSAAVNTNP